jgi:ubiquitin carboxyl-terminal hydrolase 14
MGNNLVMSLANTYEFMDKQRVSYPPLLLVQLVRTVFPQFSTTAENGMYQQQDASECWTELIRILQQKLPRSMANKSSNASNFIDEYFAGAFKATLKCDECADEPETVHGESFLQLNCFISQDVKYLQTGIKLRLEEKLTKHSPTLQRDASYTKMSKISRLPAYMCVQYVRFFYKEKDKVNAKILKDVKFQMTLDLFEVCTPDLQARLVPMREKLASVDNHRADEIKQMKKLSDSLQTVGTDQTTNVQQTTSASTGHYASYSFEDDCGSNNSGLYELIAVLTHKGRSSNSGHYVGWAKNPKSSEWLMFDDDNVCKVDEDDILKLSGGGDHHTCYILLYGPKKLDLNYYNEKVNKTAGESMQ